MNTVIIELSDIVSLFMADIAQVHDDGISIDAHTHTLVLDCVYKTVSITVPTYHVNNDVEHDMDSYLKESNKIVSNISEHVNFNKVKANDIYLNLENRIINRLKSVIPQLDFYDTKIHQLQLNEHYELILRFS